MRAAVLSDGGWGTALALLLHENGHAVTLWGPFPEYVAEMRERGENVRFLPGLDLPSAMPLTADLETAVTGAELLVLAAPSQYMRALLERLARVPVPAGAVWLNVAKGIEMKSLKRISELVAELAGPVPYAVLSGPSHAEEVARGVPTAVVAAAVQADRVERAQNALMSDTFRVYSSADVVGVELGGALKNVLALAAGVCDGMDLGDNTKAALMTRGIAEMARLGCALGGLAGTFSGLSGVGDLIVTCMSRHSRNRHVGERLAQGACLADIQADMGGQVAEGVTTCRSAFALARRHDVETPIVDQIHAVLYENKEPQVALRELMTRDAKEEWA